MGNESNSWRWSATGQHSRTGFQSWDSNNPDYHHGMETCAFLAGGGMWFDTQCSDSYTFLCFNGKKICYLQGFQTLYCRYNHKDLAMIESQEKNVEAQNAIPSNSMVWIGLYREPWTWSDGSTSSFRNWYPSGLDNYNGNQHCGTENSDHEWGDELSDLHIFMGLKMA
uniref:C-type lectin domain-containing protein n=1 Tax=Oryzias melastigma TaxID=30732 RepID=A0A3B3E0H7_ORYME